MLRPLRVRGYLKSMQGRGFSASDVLENTGLSLSDLTNPHMQITSLQSERIITNMMDLTANEALGFELGEEINIPDMGLVGHAMLAAPTIRHTVELWTRFAAPLYGSLLILSFDENAPEYGWPLYLTQNIPVSRTYQFCIEEYLALAHKMGTLMTKAPLKYQSLSLIYPEPKHSGLYESLYQCPVEFSAEKNCLITLSPGLDNTLDTRDDYLFEVYKQYCQRQSGKIKEGGQLTYQIHNYLLQNLGHPPKVEDAAKHCQFSSRTLKRRLQEEGQSFRKLLEEFRRSFATENLVMRNLHTKEVAYLLGYTDPKPFFRAFKRWTGMTITEYQQRHDKGV